MRRAPKLTRNDRASRRLNIIEALVRGQRPSELAERYGLNVDYVRKMAREAGVVTSAPRGRPRAWRECPPHLIDTYDMMIAGNIQQPLRVKAGGIE
jgi:hypothetical protein